MTAIPSISSIAQATQNPTKTRPIRSKSSDVFNGCLIELQVSLACRTQTSKVTDRRPKGKDAGSESGIHQRTAWRRFGGLLGWACNTIGHWLVLDGWSRLRANSAA